MNAFVKMLKLVAVGVLGYLLIALGQFLVLEVLLKGRTAPDAPLQVLALATVGTVASGLLGGYVSAWMGRDRPLLHTAAVMVFLLLDGVYVIVNNVGGHPLLYEVSGLLTLMAATAGGGWLRKLQRDRGAGASSVPSEETP